MPPRRTARRARAGPCGPPGRAPRRCPGRGAPRPGQQRRRRQTPPPDQARSPASVSTSSSRVDVELGYRPLRPPGPVNLDLEDTVEARREGEGDRAVLSRLLDLVAVDVDRLLRRR